MTAQNGRGAALSTGAPAHASHAALETARTRQLEERR